MNFKKYTISVIVCGLMLFSICFNMFIPLKVHASSSSGFAIDWFSNLDVVEGYYIEFAYGSTYYLCSFSSAPSSSNIVGRVVTYYFNSPVSCYQYAYTGSSYVQQSNSTSNKFTYEFTNNSLNEQGFQVVEDTSFFGRLWNGLKNMWYSTTDDTNNFIFGDDNIIDYWDNIGDNWCDFVKTTLGISDNDTLNTVMLDIYNNDYSRDYWTNIDTTTIAQLQITSNNLKQFWSNNVTVITDGDNSYHYEIKNYNPDTQRYPSYLYNTNYFNDYILYNFDTNLDDTNNILKNIYNAIVSLKCDLELQLNNLFSDIHVTIDNDNSDLDDTFWIQVRDILISKVPLYSQFVDLLEPATNTNYLSVSDNNSLLEDKSSDTTSIMFSNVGDGQLEFDTPVITPLFDSLLSIKQSADNSIVGVGVPLSYNFYGYDFDGFYFDMTYYYNNFREKVSNFILFICYIGFAWSVIHRVSRLFGGTVSNNDNNVGG